MEAEAAAVAVVVVCMALVVAAAAAGTPVQVWDTAAAVVITGGDKYKLQKLELQQVATKVS